MFSKFICINFINKGKCNDYSCKLKHINYINEVNIRNVESIVKNSKPKADKKANENDENSYKSIEVINTNKDEILTNSAPFQEGFKVRPGTKAYKDRIKKEEELMKLEKQKKKCQFFIVKGVCKKGEKCNFSHDGLKPVSASIIGESIKDSRGRGSHRRRGDRGGPVSAAGTHYRGRGGLAIPTFSHKDLSSDLLPFYDESFVGSRGIRFEHNSHLRQNEGKLITLNLKASD